MRLVYDHHRRFVQRLVVINPRVEQRIAQRHDDEEHQHAFVLDDFNHFVPPDVEHIGKMLFQSFYHNLFYLLLLPLRNIDIIQHCIFNFTKNKPGQQREGHECHEVEPDVDNGETVEHRCLIDHPVVTQGEQPRH